MYPRGAPFSLLKEEGFPRVASGNAWLRRAVCDMALYSGYIPHSAECISHVKRGKTCPKSILQIVCWIVLGPEQTLNQSVRAVIWVEVLAPKMYTE